MNWAWGPLIELFTQDRRPPLSSSVRGDRNRARGLAGPRAVPGTHQGTGVNICHALSHAFNSNNRLPEMQVSTSGIKVGQGRGVQNEVVMGAHWVPPLTAVRATSLRQTPRTKRGAAEWAPAAEHPRASSHRGHSPRASTRAPGHLSRGSPADVHSSRSSFRVKCSRSPKSGGVSQ